jgi:hypothetical protein
MKNNSAVIEKVLFVTFAGLALIAMAYQIYLSNVRPLSGLENSLISGTALTFSTVSGWYFSKIYSQNTSNNKTIEDLIKILEGSVKVGLVAIEPQLKHGTTTIDALNEMSYGFDFLGIGGSKFLAKIFDERTKTGRFIAKNTRDTIRILLLDPDCELIGVWLIDDEKAEKVRQNIRESLKILANQIHKGRKIQVRLYNFTPPMRIQIVDEEIAYICEYDPLGDGWDSPQLCFAKKGEKPLLHSLMSLYDNFWIHSKEFQFEKYL